MKILQLCYKMPFPTKDGGEYSIRNSALSLLTQPDVELKVLAMNTKRNWVNPKSIPNDFSQNTNFSFVKVDTRIRPIKMFLNLFTNNSYFIERFYSKDYEQQIIEILKRDNYNVILIEHLYLCVYLKTIRNNFKGKVVLRAQNVEYKVWETYLESYEKHASKWYLKLALKRLKKFEYAILNKLDGIINLTNEDQAIYESFGSKTPSTSIPIGFNHSLLKGYNYEKQFKKETVVYHLGSMDWRPNIQGVQWFLKEVLPILKELHPDLQIRLAGKKMPKAFYAYHGENVHVDGEVENALRYQEDKAILIVPLLAGSGIRVKIIEALALGKSIISTTVGAQGIEYTEGEDILIADNPKSFAETILKCVNSLEMQRKLSKNAIDLANSKYNLENIGQQKIAFFKQLIEVNNNLSKS